MALRYHIDTSGWHNSSPANFTLAVKVSRFITHIKRLKNAEDAVEKFERGCEKPQRLLAMTYQEPLVKALYLIVRSLSPLKNLSGSETSARVHVPQ